jgi:PBSX family phage terminase large subunit
MPVTKAPLRLTDKQREIVAALRQPNRYTLIVGGARSGKTTGIIATMVADAYQFPGSRQLIAREKFNHVKASIWNETLPFVLSEYPRVTYTKNETELTLRFTNGSQIICNGLDDDRVEKILGTEYCRIYLNECSQIKYKTVKTVLTRLAQNIPGLPNKIIYDLNPVGLTHWTYRLFLQGVDPMDPEEPIADHEQYNHVFANPADNAEHLPPEYLAQLDALPEFERRRFLLGEYQKPPGAVFYNFDRSKHVVPFGEVPPLDDFDKFSVGVDLGNNSVAILVGWMGERAYALDEIYERRVTNATMNAVITDKWGGLDYYAYIDHNHGEAVLDDYDNSMLAIKGAGSVELGINVILQLMESDNYRVSEQCTNLIADMESYHRNEETGRIVEEGNEHGNDAQRYAIYTELKLTGGSVTLV